MASHSMVGVRHGMVEIWYGMANRVMTYYVWVCYGRACQCRGMVLV